MRIIGGKLKGRRFSPSGKLPVRPTTDYAREGLFNVIENQTEIKGKSVLDLFSGTGSIALEFASREAEKVNCVDLNKMCCDQIRELAAQFGLKNIKVYRRDAFRIVGAIKDSFDIVFADPPYAHSKLPLLPEMVLNSSLLNSGGIFILEHPKKTTFNLKEIIDHRSYGNVNFTWFKK